MSASAPNAILALTAIWLAWAVSWLAAWRWTAGTERAAGGRPQSAYRIVNLIGWLLLFGDGVFRTSPRGPTWQPFLPPLWHLSATAGWVMVAVALGGMAFAWSARVALGRLWSVDVTRKTGHRIVDGGPYAIVRHPIYTGILLGAIALMLAKGTPIALAGCVLMIVGYHLKARVEERFLADELGRRAYADYARRVPMLLPFGPH
ncbi:methyltransferase family protein [Sphingomonas nostoxanthinifaciens]|uniref:methyltransferase family protein n=1 Tax=Sphingomonas nostoxanthinifaciens TaxID=2872652 RepID=UPI001CC1D4F9|nr:isoprenylcysteine carboxylmethyltransferase family protein [Sphingomonas nostoxanthinifaciens]UAK25430.1 isoprenylcysteine carboxylmethyltransferase family protein [Sphingomonas nostoxanthinifaciens]